MTQCTTTMRHTLILLFALLTLSCFPKIVSAHDMNTGKIDMTLVGTVTASNEATFTATLISGLTPGLIPGADGGELRLYWTLPDGGELLDGAAQQMWPSVPANLPFSQARRVRLAGPGVYELIVEGGLAMADGMTFRAGARRYLVVDQNGKLTVEMHDPRNVGLLNERVEPLLDDPIAENAVQAAAIYAANGDPCHSFSGQFLREEHTPISTGYASMVLVPVRAALVEMREEDDFFDDTYGEAITDSEGRFSFSFCDDDGFLGGDLELYVRLTAEIRSPQGKNIVEIQEDGFIPEEDVYEIKTAIVQSSGGSFNKRYELNRQYSAIFNMADAVYDAWLHWNLSGGAGGVLFDNPAEINWEPDDGDTSLYNDFTKEITIGDAAAGRPDEWDDSAIIHEWSHQADDQYSCDDPVYESHSSADPAQDPELAWAEGYANYNQSAVRAAFGRPDAELYIDNGGPGSSMVFTYSLETRDIVAPSLRTWRNEAAVAALLWDLSDSASDGQDKSGFTHRTVQEVFTHPTFESNGDLWDDTCTAPVFLDSWRDIGKTANREVAAIIEQNIGIANYFGNSTAVSITASDAHESSQVNAQATTEDVRWWNVLSWVVDTSASMATADKLGAVKTVIKEQINDLAPSEKGTEFTLYTFDNTSAQLQPRVAQKFYEEFVTPAVDGLTPSPAPDSDCSVNALGALAQAARQQKGGDIWLYTDRSTRVYPSVPQSVDTMRSLLDSHLVKGSFAMLGDGGCVRTLPATQEQISGGEQVYLGNAANGSQPTGIVPYLLTALGTGGQFLYVREDQLGSAVDILSAQIANSAGAGKWSDYVSDEFTYRWDRLEAGEYQWIDLLPPLTGIDRGSFGKNDKWSEPYTLPQNFPFYGSNMGSVRVSLDGYVEFNPCSGQFCILEKRYLENLFGGPQWSGNFPPAVAASTGNESSEMDVSPSEVAADCSGFLPVTGWFAKVYTTEQGDWHIISTHGCANPNPNFLRKYQIWLNTQTGEIRYLYQALTANDAANARIGLRVTAFTPGFPDSALVIKDKDISGASSGMGYKFTPAPPQPTRTYNVAVDSLTSAVGFLQTGYSGKFEPMIVRDPAGTPVDCADSANVLCVTMNNVGTDRMVQYVQVNTIGKTGDWMATIDASAGEATFTFSALATSPIAAQSTGNHNLTLGQTGKLALTMGQATDGNVLTAWMQKPNGQRIGSEFQLFDDGNNDDGAAGDGRFGLLNFTPPGQDALYLWVKGNSGGVEFVRSDPVPYNVQPIAVTALQKNVVSFGTATAITFVAENTSNKDLCFQFGENVNLPEGWTYSWVLVDDGSELLFGATIPANGSIQRTLLVTPNSGFVAGASHAQSEVSVAFVECERGAISDSDSVTITRLRPPHSVQLVNNQGENSIRPNDVDTATLTLRVRDETGAPVIDGTFANLSIDLGATVPATVQTVNGAAAFLVAAGTQVGDATITAEAEGIIVTSTLHVRNASPTEIELSATPLDLSGSVTSSSLVVTVRDDQGDPVAGVSVRIGVSDDDSSHGTVGNGQVLTGTTNANGQVVASFVKSAGSSGTVAIRAEYFVVEGSGLNVVDTANQNLILSPIVNEQRVFLPLVNR